MIIANLIIYLFLCNPTNSNEVALEKVSNLDGVKVIQIAAGAEHSAVVTGKFHWLRLFIISYIPLFPNYIVSLFINVIAENRALMTWGWGEHGQLGLGNTSDQIHPKVVNLGDEVQNEDTQLEVFCGSGFTYAISTHCLPSHT